MFAGMGPRPPRAGWAVVVSVALLLSVASFPAGAHGKKGGNGTAWGKVEYDSRSLLINGKRELLFSGSIHYPRSTPDMWDDLILKSKHGGLNMIQTYVFWNGHEPQPGVYNFKGNYDLVRFVKLVQKHNMYVSLRIGPFIQAEWNYGGFPFWLREVSNITFRTNNEPFKFYMERFTRVIVDLMKDHNLFANQGGPIVLAQIENEYNNIAAAYKDDGVKYVRWAAKMATGMYSAVPWVMCKQKNAPESVISVCNGRNCGDTFTGPESPNKPLLWTENWTAQYRVFGDPPSQRSAEDLAYSVARFFSKNGTMTNYYMYHGGTNFGRTGSAYVMTRYYDEAPLDEYGLFKEPKWGHLRDLHSALRLAKKALLWGKYSVQTLGKDLEARVYEKTGGGSNDAFCVAFLSNNNTRVDQTVQFHGTDYFLPRKSISILPDCKTVVFNTQRVNSQHNARTFHNSKEANSYNSDDDKWFMWRESLPNYDTAPIKTDEPLELMGVTKDTSDYLWYTTKFTLDEEDLPMRRDIRPVISIANQGHVMHAFVNGKLVGTGHGSKLTKEFTLQKAADLKAGVNEIALLGMTVGLPDSGAYLEKRMAGLTYMMVKGLNTGTLDLSFNRWGHTVGMQGEKMKVYNQKGSQRVPWSSPVKKGVPVVWYKRYFDTPHGNDPVALDLSTMGKGLVWINGKCIGRYWVSYLSPLGKPSQSIYHIPRSFLKPGNKNLMVVFEEHNGDPEGIAVMTVKRDNICTVVSEFHPAHVRSWARKDSQFKTVAEDVKPRAELRCSTDKFIREISFASFGNPGGVCGNLTVGTCHSANVKEVAEKNCLGRTSCVLPVKPEDYGADRNCAGTTLTLAVQAKCARKKSSN